MGCSGLVFSCQAHQVPDALVTPGFKPVITNQRVLVCSANEIEAAFRPI